MKSMFEVNDRVEFVDDGSKGVVTEVESVMTKGTERIYYCVQFDGETEQDSFGAGQLRKI